MAYTIEGVNASLQISPTAPAIAPLAPAPRHAPLACALAASAKKAHPPIAPQHASHIPDTQPYWQYLEKQNRRHDIRGDAQRGSPPVPIILYRPCASGSNGSAHADTRPAYAMPRLGEVLPSTKVSHETRMNVQTITQVLAPNGRLVDALA